MNMVSLQNLADYWSLQMVTTNLIVFLNLLGALLLGMIVGYERTYHGRAAGMRTYGLVCMAAAALTSIAGFPELWFGGHAPNVATADPTRVIQGIVTGIGFLGAGMIMKDGLNISGLTTAASIWASSAIGVLVGVGFYASAMLLTGLSVVCMMWMSRLEQWLPTHQAVSIGIAFRSNYIPRREALEETMRELGYGIAWGSLTIKCEEDCTEWHFVAVAHGKDSCRPLPDISRALTGHQAVERFSLSYARN
ncbi:MgtC/SapB family protein [Vogesella oryzae]|uniref:MgtC/SapB family protein n=1 Tax=Vogesella oryzae TaxID=1735285 RepID=UPI001581FAF8|nr:MgtC/SapB family protein [Vogesella oryzae]